MEPIRIRTKVESETLRLPQLKPLIGKVVDMLGSRTRPGQP